MALFFETLSLPSLGVLGDHPITYVEGAIQLRPRPVDALSGDPDEPSGSDDAAGENCRVAALGGFEVISGAHDAGDGDAVEVLKDVLYLVDVDVDVGERLIVVSKSGSGGLEATHDDVVTAASGNVLCGGQGRQVEVIGGAVSGLDGVGKNHGLVEGWRDVDGSRRRWGAWSRCG